MDMSLLCPYKKTIQYMIRMSICYQGFQNSCTLENAIKENYKKLIKCNKKQ